MKKYLFLLLLVCCSYEAKALDLEGNYLSQSGELLFKFKADSLYIELAQSHRSVSAFKLIKKKDSKKIVTYNAFENYMDNGKMTAREVMIRLTKKGSKKFLLEYFGKDKDREYNTNERYTIKKVD